MFNDKSVKNFLIAIVALAVIGLGYLALTQPDHRDVGQKISDAADALPDLGKAGRQLEDRTPAEKIGDAAKDVKEDIKDAAK